MGNWGQPDFTDTIPEEQIKSLHLRILGETEGKGLIQWPHNDLVERGYPPDKVQLWCVQDANWQQVRLSMKGIPTHEKLATLKRWWDKHSTFEGLPCKISQRAQCQVGNYLGALRRGGQLDDANRVRKY